MRESTAAWFWKTGQGSACIFKDDNLTRARKSEIFEKIDNVIEKYSYQLHVNLGRVLSLIWVNQILRLTKI